MFETKSLLFAMGALTAFGVCAQSLDEISELQKAKVIAELRSQIASANRYESLPGSGAPAIPIAAQPFSLTAQAPNVIAIFGLDGTSLQASISDPSGGKINVRPGDVTPSGWVVERISRSALTFSKPGAQKNVGRGTGLRASAADLTRVTVAWGEARSVVTAEPRDAYRLALPNSNSNSNSSSGLSIPIVPALRPGEAIRP